jgi:hypothetical protein
LGGNGGIGVPSAIAGLLTLYLPMPVAGSRIKEARNKTANGIAYFFMEEPSW